MPGVLLFGGESVSNFEAELASLARKAPRFFVVHARLVEDSFAHYFRIYLAVGEFLTIRGPVMGESRGVLVPPLVSRIRLPPVMKQSHFLD